MFTFTNPDKNVAELHLQGTEKVVVFGSGAGGHSFALLRALQHGGTVIAVDVRADMLAKIQRDAQQLHDGRFKTKHADYQRMGGTQLMDNSVDVVVIPNTLFSAEQKEEMLAEAFRVTKQGGKLLLVDWAESFNGMGPQQEYLVSIEDARALAEQVGFSFKRDFRAGAHHYGLVCKKGV